ncbi:MAG: hypothetical protein PHI12_08220 [Dehalococcoidales bacterium]|nr:hypothetical protein [Dehalococcoidales bacterium]
MNRKNKLVLGAGIATIISGAIYMAAHKKAEGGGGGGGGGALTFSTPVGTLQPATGVGYGWHLAEISCTLTNPSSSSITRQIKVVYDQSGWRDDRVWEYVKDVNNIWSLALSPKIVEVTIPASGSLTVTQPGEFIIPGVDPYLYGSLWNPPAFGPSSSHQFKLVDDLGNESPIITLTRTG